MQPLFTFRIGATVARVFPGGFVCYANWSHEVSALTGAARESYLAAKAAYESGQ